MIEISIVDLQEKFDTLPENLRWAIMAANVNENITEIGRIFNLNVEQMGQLSLETHGVMYGYTHPDKFEESVKASMQLPDDKTKEIVNAVNEKILKNIREQLMSLTETKSDDVGSPDASIEAFSDKETTKEDKKDTEILGNAGIEIMPEEITAPRKEVPPVKDPGILSGAGIEITTSTPIINRGENMEKRNEMLSDVENPDLINKVQSSFSAQKLSNSYNIPPVKTDHSLPSMSKNNDSNSTNTATPNRIDPYREIPE